MQALRLAALPVQRPKARPVVVRNSQAPAAAVESQAYNTAWMSSELCNLSPLGIQQPDSHTIRDRPQTARVRGEPVGPGPGEPHQLPRSVRGVDPVHGAVIGPAQESALPAIGGQRQNRASGQRPDRKGRFPFAEVGNANTPVPAGECRITSAALDANAGQRRVNDPVIQPDAVQGRPRRRGRRGQARMAAAPALTPPGTRAIPVPAPLRPDCGR